MREREQLIFAFPGYPDGRILSFPRIRRSQEPTGNLISDGLQLSRSSLFGRNSSGRSDALHNRLARKEWLFTVVSNYNS
jgi:hypothetical protein